MNKKVQSFTVVIITIICSSAMIFQDGISQKANCLRDKIAIISKKNIVHKKSTNLEKQNEIKKQNYDLEKKESLNKDFKPENNNTNKPDSSNLVSMTEKYKNLKMDKAGEELEKDKEEFFNHDNLKESIDSKKPISKNKEKNLQEYNNSTENNTSNSSAQDVPVFKVSRSKIKDSLTLSDKSKLLGVASKLSAVDYDKVNKYLQSGSDEDVKNTIKLLKERLSDKDYDKVKEVAKKFINMDVVEQ